MKYVDKIIFRDKETYNKLYQGSELLFEVKKEVVWKGLTFTALEPSRIEYKPSKVSTAQYSYDTVNWNSADNVTLKLNTGEKIYFKGNITGEQNVNNHSQFIMTGKVDASGSVMSLQAGNPEDKSLKYNYEFGCLFFDCPSLVTAPELPATTLTKGCYQQMFDGAHIVDSPALPATTLAEECYYKMLSSSTLVNAPVLPAKTLARSCYSNMFYGCTSLVTAPELPATTLADNCYSFMFAHSSIVNAPALPATTLAESCYDYMFYYCTHLVNAPVLPAKTLAKECYESMFEECTRLVKVPNISATTLEFLCYQEMFKNCKNLNYIKCDTREYNRQYFYDWVGGVSSNGDFYCYDSSILPTGSNGIPKGWRIHSEIAYDALYVSGRYEFKIPKGDGTYYIIDTKNDCEADVITDNDFTSLNQTIIASNSVGDKYEWELFFNSTKLYFDMGYKIGERLIWSFGTLTKDTVYTIGGSNGNYLGTDMAIYVNGSKNVYSNSKSPFNNESDIIKIGENVTNVYIGNIKIYEKTGLVYNIVPIMYKGKVEFYDTVNRQFIEIISKPSSQYAKTRLTGEKIGI